MPFEGRLIIVSNEVDFWRKKFSITTEIFPLKLMVVVGIPTGYLNVVGLCMEEAAEIKPGVNETPYRWAVSGRIETPFLALELSDLFDSPPLSRAGSDELFKNPFSHLKN